MEKLPEQPKVETPPQPTPAVLVPKPLGPVHKIDLDKLTFEAGPGRAGKIASVGTGSTIGASAQLTPSACGMVCGQRLLRQQELELSDAVSSGA
jgi:hypothetical protein